MHENDNEVPNREVLDAAEENAPAQEQAEDHAGAPEIDGAREERQAEEFAEEMEAEPHNIDGEAGEATPAEEAAADAASHGDATNAPMSEPEPGSGEPPAKPQESMSADEILAPDAGKEQPKWPAEDAELTAMLEAVIYITDEPLTLEQICTALEQPRDRIKRLLSDLVAEWQKPQHGLSIREVAGGYKMTTKPEHHDAVRQFVKSLKAPMKLSLPALETLAVIAYKQPVTSPEIMEIRGVQGAGVLKTLIDRKLIAPAGRKNVIGKPILYKTTREFLVQFGLKDLSELPSVKEFEELARFATEPEPSPMEPNPPAATRRQESAPEPPAEAEAPQNATTVAEAAEVEGESSQSKQEPETEPATEPVTE
jgi:segregation and condensation protein B